MTDSSQPQPNEIERIACSGCGSFLRLERSMPERVGHPRYDMMRCVRCEFIQYIADESVSGDAIAQAARTLTGLRASVSCWVV
jgi:RNase P subunit RPR2